ncbi:hypothetical protein CKY39_27295 [Variovorax boronicumulans]|uniref:TspB protein n=2 Tax=Variovorax boronicumulans TaxID=436515 RepID=A0A250DQ85_9BURK|nr:hypothetical protein CKY39_27295 [Variovorax boronicumulans]
MKRNQETGNVEGFDGPGQPAVSDGFEYRYAKGGAQFSNYWLSSDAACQDWAPWWNGANSLSTGQKIIAPIFYEAGQCHGKLVSRTNESQVINTNFLTNVERRTSSCPPTWFIVFQACYSEQNLPRTPYSVEQVAQRLASVAPDPRVWGETLERGGEIPMPNPTVTGPSQIQGPETVKQNQDGSREVSRTTYNFTTNGNQITNTSIVTTTNHFNSSNVQTGTTTTTTTPVEEEPGSTQEETPPVDTPLGPLPKLYERKYPDGLVGIWNEKKEQLKQSQLFSLPSQLLPTGVSGGSCPSWTIPLDMAGFHDWGMADLTVPCWVYDVLKAIVLIGAAILARALIFGG